MVLSDVIFAGLRAIYSSPLGLEHRAMLRHATPPLDPKKVANRSF